MTESLPHWTTSTIYPGLESAEFEAAVGQVARLLSELEGLFNQPADQLNKAEFFASYIEQFNDLYELGGTIRAYIQAFITTDSRNKLAKKRMSEFEKLIVQLQKLDNAFQAQVGKLGSNLEPIIQSHPTLQAHAFAMRETADQSKYMMSPAEEELAAELSTSGVNAWNRLQGTIISQLGWEFELDGKTQKLPMPALINLHNHPDESVRRRAYEAEMTAWKTIEEPLAAALNSIKGTTNTLNARRGRKDALHGAIDMARIDRETLNAMLSAMHDSFPVFRKYFLNKAKRLGKEKLAWWDIFAPIGNVQKTYTWAETKNFIETQFGTFSPELASFARRAFDEGWMDAEPRDGKRAGAFCMSVPLLKESRILANFDGSLDEVSTIAHELGHAFHNECMYQAGKTEIQAQTPMTLAETASIMCETIVSEALLSEIKDPVEELNILETRLCGDAQVIVDIYSRYLFEKEVFERREKSELSADEICEIMEQAQAQTYGEALDENYRHKYMWTWKPHYYYAGLSFYNFPYAFGLLFSLGLYAIYQQRGPAFVNDYKNLLASTGEANAADLAARFGIDIRSPKFWEDSLGIIAKKVDRYCEL